MILIHKPCGNIYDTLEALSRHSTHCPQTSHSSNPLTGLDDLQARPSGRETGMHSSVPQTSHSQPSIHSEKVESRTQIERSECAGVLHSELRTSSPYDLALVKHTARKGTSQSSSNRDCIGSIEAYVKPSVPHSRLSGFNEINLDSHSLPIGDAMSACPCDSGASQ